MSKDNSHLTEEQVLIHDLNKKVDGLEGELDNEKKMVDHLLKIPGLYYNYKRKNDDAIIKYLEKVKIVKKEHKGVGTEFGFYPLNDEAMDKILKNPRGNSLSFDATNTSDEIIKGLIVYKEVKYLVKSTSRFFLKPDIGEIIDQIGTHDFYNSNVKAILFNPDSYQELPGTEGEHFIMTAHLLVEETGK